MFGQLEDTWYAIPFSEDKEPLEVRYRVDELPKVIVLQPNGQTISMTGTDEIKRIGVDSLKKWAAAIVS